MKVSSAKLFGLELLLLLMITATACIACPIQFIGKKDTGSTSGFLFPSSVYEYNIFAYVLGLLLFVAVIALTYRFAVRRYVSSIQDVSTASKILMILVALIFAFLMFVGVFFETLLFLGLSGNARPESLLMLTGFGWPVAAFLYILTLIVVNWKPRKEKKAEDPEG